MNRGLRTLQVLKPYLRVALNLCVDLWGRVVTGTWDEGFLPTLTPLFPFNSSSIPKSSFLSGVLALKCFLS